MYMSYILDFLVKEDTKGYYILLHYIQGRIYGEGGGGAPPKIGKNMICWRKIVIFHTKYPKNFRASLRSAQFF